LSRHKNATTTLVLRGQSVSQVKSQSTNHSGSKRNHKNKNKAAKRPTQTNSQNNKKIIFLSKQNGYRKLANFYFFLATRSR
jgi:predicted Zn-dependent protease